MDKLNLSSQTLIQLTMLGVEQEQNIKNITNLLSKIDQMCKEEAGMSLDQLIDSYDYCIDKLEEINTEKMQRHQPILSNEEMDKMLAL